MSRRDISRSVAKREPDHLAKCRPTYLPSYRRPRSWDHRAGVQAQVAMYPYEGGEVIRSAWNRGHADDLRPGHARCSGGLRISRGDRERGCSVRAGLFQALAKSFSSSANARHASAVNGCPGGAAVGSADFAGDGVAGAGAAEAVRLVVAEVPGGGGDPGDQAARVVHRGGSRGRGGVPGWDIGQGFRWRGYVLSGWDRDSGEGGQRSGGDGDEGGAGELASFGQHAGGDPPGRAHLGEPVRRRGSGQGVAAALGGGQPAIWAW
jgi:hypothetical protein